MVGRAGRRREAAMHAQALVGPARLHRQREVAQDEALVERPALRERLQQPERVRRPAERLGRLARRLPQRRRRRAGARAAARPRGADRPSAPGTGRAPRAARGTLGQRARPIERLVHRDGLALLPVPLVELGQAKRGSRRGRRLLGEDALARDRLRQAVGAHQRVDRLPRVRAVRPERGEPVERGHRGRRLVGAARERGHPLLERAVRGARAGHPLEQGQGPARIVRPLVELGQGQRGVRAPGLDLERALVDADRLRPAILLDEQAAQGDQRGRIARAKGHELALDAERARPVARGPVERDQALPHRLVPRVRLAAMLQHRDLLLARGAARRRQQAVAGLDVAGREARQHPPVLERAIAPPERVVDLGERAPALGIAGPPPDVRLQHRRGLVLAIQAAGRRGQLGHRSQIGGVERHELAQHRQLPRVVGRPEVHGEQAIQERAVVRAAARR